MTRDAGRILVPVDFSPTSEEALDYAVDLARRLEATLDVLHVMNGDKRPLVALNAAGHATHGMRAAADELTELLLAKDLGGLAVEPHLRGGYPATEILEHIEHTQPEVVVMGTHGRTGVRRVFLGSQCQEVMRRSPVPITVVRGRDANERYAP